VNALGFVNGDRYLPDRRDLNRCFPGSARGSLGSRTAHIFMSEVVSRCSVGIDFHSGSDHRTNLPQIRADLHDETTHRLAAAFAAPVMMHAPTRDGSLRKAAAKTGASVLLFEGGEAWRFSKDAIDVGVRGVTRVLAHVGVAPLAATEPTSEPYVLRTASWIRTPQSGIARLDVELGEFVEPRQSLGVVADAIGNQERIVRARTAGVVIGRNESPVVHRGDALVNIGRRGPNEEDAS
jgi:predicted deacylase